MPKIYVATQSRVFNRDGGRVVVRKGVSRAAEGSWIVQQHPELWKPIDVHFDVEQATAAPGEKRDAPPRAGKGSGTKAWRAYAEQQGVDVPDDAGRDDIIALVEG